MVPVKFGLAIGAFASSPACVAVEMAFKRSVALSAFPRPTAALDTPITVPVNVGLRRGACKASAVAVAVEMGFRASVVLSTFPSPTAALDTPTTVPVKLGLPISVQGTCVSRLQRYLDIVIFMYSPFLEWIKPEIDLDGRCTEDGTDTIVVNDGNTC